MIEIKPDKELKGRRSIAYRDGEPIAHIVRNCANDKLKWTAVLNLPTVDNERGLVVRGQGDTEQDALIQAIRKTAAYAVNLYSETELMFNLLNKEE